MSPDPTAQGPPAENTEADRTAADEVTQPAPVKAVSGAMVGAYQLLQMVGEGGMGEVWLAEQKHPVRRRVALKLVKAGVDTRQVVARFQSERQAIALMDHPAIAKVFDAGSSAEGRPYFVMEYVAGVPISTYCDTHKLTMRERLVAVRPSMRRRAARSSKGDYPPGPEALEHLDYRGGWETGSKDHRLWDC
ncbi:MAG: protein kinase domain-containing protein [Bryobacteraceae bacterium]